MKILSLFSDVGGLELALRIALPEVVVMAYVERNPACCSILRNRVYDGSLPPASQYADIEQFPAQDYVGKVNLVCGGFPCQDVSVSGKKAGVERGTRSGLWYEFVNVIRIVGPSYVFLENVDRLVRSGLNSVLGSLADLGFDAEWEVLPASAVGAPHRRSRLFLLAYSRAAQLESPDPAGLCRLMVPPAITAAVGRLRVGYPAFQRHAQWLCFGGNPGPELAAVTRASAPALFPPLPARIDAWGELLRERPDLAPTVESPVRGMADGMADWMDRIRGCGNGVVPLQAAAAFVRLARRLIDEEGATGSPGVSRAARHGQGGDAPASGGGGRIAHLPGSGVRSIGDDGSPGAGGGGVVRDTVPGLLPDEAQLDAYRLLRGMPPANLHPMRPTEVAGQE